jgi:adenylate kinase family enzyme
LRDRRRVLVVGASGAGKSTLSVRLGRALDLPVVHLDRHYWRSGWEETPEEEWEGILARLLERPAWVMDGSYDLSLPDRLRRADAVVFLDLAPWRYRLRIFRRVLTTWGRNRPDLAAGCPEKWDLSFVRWVWAWHRDRRPIVLRALEGAPSGVEIVRLRTPREVRDFERRIASGNPSRPAGI